MNEILNQFTEPAKVGYEGFVRLVDVMGDDAAIVQAARVSYGAGTKIVSEDRALIRYLMRHQHTSPFEMCEIKLHIKAPIHVMRQWIRHRTANVNETSTRYSIVQDKFELFENVRTQSTDNKQGSGDLLDSDFAPGLIHSANESISNSFSIYNSLVEAGVAREQARNVLPLATYTEVYWKIDLHNLFHFLRLRVHPHAQQEIREFAQAILNIVKAWVPIAYEAFIDYRLEGASFSKQELEIIQQALNSLADTCKTSLQDVVDLTKLSKREQKEFLGKIYNHG